MTIFTLCHHILQHCGAAVSAACCVAVCGKAWQTVSSSTCQQGLINRQILYHTTACFSGEGTLVSVFTLHTIQFALIVEYVLYGQIVIAGRLTEEATLLQTWQCVHSVKHFHFHNPHVTPDNCKGFPRSAFNQLYETIVTENPLLAVEKYWTSSISTYVVCYFFYPHKGSTMKTVATVKL